MNFLRYGNYMSPVFCSGLHFLGHGSYNHVMGMVLNEEGNETGTWIRINKNFKTINFNPNHQTWANIKTIENEYGSFVEIPITWVRTEILQSGPYAGKQCWWISDVSEPGFHIHPCFVGPDGATHSLKIAKYLTSKRNNQPYSQDTDSYWTGISYNTLHNINYENCRPYNIYDHHFLARMMLIEFGTPNVKIQTVDGISWNGTNRIIYHNIHDIFGIQNLSCWIDGFTTINNTYQILTADGSRSMINLDTPCINASAYPINCLSGPSDVFIANQANDLESYGSFTDLQELQSNSAFCTAWGRDSYYGAFYLQSNKLNTVSNNIGWRLVYLS